MATIGLIAGSYKPFHAGHDAIIRLASRECDQVHLYVSVSDRARPGEVPILGSDMAMLWKQTIEPSLPSNVRVVYGGSPIGNIWKELGAANEAKSQDDYVIYSDPTDMSQNFEQKYFDKYCGELYAQGHVKLRPVDRKNTVEVSGTKMREYLQQGDKAAFVRYLPKGVDADLIWNTLYRTAEARPLVKKTAGPSRKKPAEAKKKEESVLRRYVRLLFGR